MRLTNIYGNFLDICREGKTPVYHAVTGTITLTEGETTATGSGTLFTTELAPGNALLIAGESLIVDTIESNTAITFTEAPLASASAQAINLVNTAGSSYRPNDTEANWTKVGDVEEADFDPKIDTEEVMAPQETGGYARKDKLTKISNLEITLTTNDMSELIMELAMVSSGAISALFTPMSGDGMIRGWFRLRQRAQNGGLVNKLIVWCELSLGTLKMGNAVPKPALTLSVLQNAKNYGNLTLSAA